MKKFFTYTYVYTCLEEIKANGKEKKGYFISPELPDINDSTTPRFTTESRIYGDVFRERKSGNTI